MEPRFTRDIQECLGVAVIVVPLRHPRIIARGWKSRAKSMEMLSYQWMMLKEIVDPYKPYYLPIENDDRDEWLATFSKGIGRYVDDSWPVVGKSPEPKPDLNKEEEGFVASWMDDGFFKQFGYEL